MTTTAQLETRLSAAAREQLVAEEGGPFLVSDWTRAVFLHYAMDPACLQPHLPFELDLRDGLAYVSLVAFSFEDARVCVGGRQLRWASASFSGHGFLNVRTYVRHRGETGIYFLVEWLPNQLSCFVGPRTFGLPYRHGDLRYDHRPETGRLRGDVKPTGGEGALRYSATVDAAARYAPCEAGGLDAFLMERYAAFTERRGVERRFRVWHEPWPQVAIEAAVDDDSALRVTGGWIEEAELVGANYSPGVRGVWIGRPRCLNGLFC